MKMFGEFRMQLTHPEHFFISCYTVRRNAAQRKFGSWLVTVQRAPALLRAVTQEYPQFFWGRVRYYDPKKMASAGRPEHLWLSKPAEFAYEHEFRLLVLAHGHATGHAERASARLVVGDMTSYAEISHDP